MKGESLNTSIPPPHFQSRGGMLNHIGGIYSHSGMMDYPRMESWKNSRLYGISQLESQLQDLGLSKNSRSSAHNALDQRKMRKLNQLTNLLHRDRLQGSLIFLISICLMR